MKDFLIDHLHFIHYFVCMVLNLNTRRHTSFVCSDLSLTHFFFCLYSRQLRQLWSGGRHHSLTERVRKKKTWRELLTGVWKRERETPLPHCSGGARPLGALLICSLFWCCIRRTLEKDQLCLLILFWLLWFDFWWVNLSDFSGSRVYSASVLKCGLGL